MLFVSKEWQSWTLIGSVFHTNWRRVPAGRWHSKQIYVNMKIRIAFWGSSCRVAKSIPYDSRVKKVLHPEAQKLTRFRPCSISVVMWNDHPSNWGSLVWDFGHGFRHVAGFWDVRAIFFRGVYMTASFYVRFWRLSICIDFELSMVS